MAMPTTLSLPYSAEAGKVKLLEQCDGGGSPPGHSVPEDLEHGAERHMQSVLRIDQAIGARDAGLGKRRTVLELRDVLIDHSDSLRIHLDYFTG
jgi:hypothetical protein